MCEKSKQQVEVCRSPVTAALNNTRVSCRIATSICSADVICSTALSYYNQNCRSMFKGKKCSHRLVSLYINILKSIYLIIVTNVM